MKTRRLQQGFSLIELLIVVAIIGIIAAIRTLSSVEETYRSTNGSGLRYASLDDLRAARLIDSALSSATTAATAKSGYIYKVTLTASDTNYCAGAAPTSDSVGTRNFSTDMPGVIYTHALDAATPPTSTEGGQPFNSR